MKNDAIWACDCGETSGRGRGRKLTVDRHGDRLLFVLLAAGDVAGVVASVGALERRDGQDAVEQYVHSMFHQRLKAGAGADALREKEKRNEHGELWQGFFKNNSCFCAGFTANKDCFSNVTFISLLLNLVISIIKTWFIDMLFYQ